MKLLTRIWLITISVIFFITAALSFFLLNENPTATSKHIPPLTTLITEVEAEEDEANEYLILSYTKPWGSFPHVKPSDLLPNYFSCITIQPPEFSARF